MTSPSPQPAEVYRPLLDSPEITVADYDCDGSERDSDERIHRPEIVFVRSGSFRVESSLGRVLADSAQVLFLPPDESIRISHPRMCGDRCLVLSIAPPVLRELLAEARPAAAPDSARVFDRPALPCLPRWFAEHRRLRERISRQPAPDHDLDLVENALRLVAETLGGSGGRRASAPASPERRAERRDRVEAIQLRIVHSLDRSTSLSELGDEVGVSGYRLAREFRSETGLSVHQYRLGLRLHAAAERLADGESDLTALALDLGFADHAHFSNSFRRRFGVSPSSYRRSFDRLEQSSPRQRSTPAARSAPIRSALRSEPRAPD